MRHRFRRRTLLWVCLAFAGGSCGAVQHDNAVDTFAKLRATWLKAFEQHDLESSVALFQPDAIFVTPFGELYPDRAAIRTLYRSVMATYRSQMSLTSVRLQSSDTLTVDYGNYSESLTEIASGKRALLRGSYLFVWRLQPDHSWKIAELLWTNKA